MQQQELSSYDTIASGLWEVVSDYPRGDFDTDGLIVETAIHTGYGMGQLTPEELADLQKIASDVLYYDNQSEEQGE